MTIIKVLLFFLAALPIFCKAININGNAYASILRGKKDAPINCPEGFVVDGTLTRCLKVATGYEDSCEESKQCSEFLSVGAVCQDNKCLCLDGYHYLHGECHKSKGLFEKCEQDEDCFVNAEYNAVTCLENVCRCRDGFYQREYSTCRRKAKGLNNECLINSDCVFHEGALCINQTCILSKEAKHEETKYYEQNKEQMNLSAIASITSTSLVILVGDNCKVDDDCGSVTNSFCGADNKCTCLRAHFASDELTECIPEIGEQCTDKDKLHVEFAVCKDGQWTCSIDQITSKNNRLCNEVLNYSDKCISNELCQLLGPRAKCENKSCQCDSKSHWLQNETFCWLSKEIDEECESNNDCYAIENSLTPVCQKNGDKNVCTCPSKSHISENREHKVCIPDETELGSYCVQNSDCSVGHSICQNNKCQCGNHYFESEKICLPGLNAECEENSDCKLSNTECRKGTDGATCQCTDNFIATPGRICITKSAFNQSCSCNLQCSAVTADAFCMKEETFLPDDNCEDGNLGECRCSQDDYYRDGTCFKKKKLGQECSKEGECFTKGGQHAVCRNGICSCDFEHKSDGDDCIPANYSNSIKMSLWTILLLSVFLYH